MYTAYLPTRTAPHLQHLHYTVLSPMLLLYYPVYSIFVYSAPSTPFLSTLSSPSHLHSPASTLSYLQFLPQYQLQITPHRLYYFRHVYYAPSTTPSSTLTSSMLSHLRLLVYINSIYTDFMYTLTYLLYITLDYSAVHLHRSRPE